MKDFINYIKENKKYPSGLNIFIDIDKTIAILDIDKYGLDYSKSEPIIENIEIVNELYDAGNTITFYSARGASSKIDWTVETIKQFNRWGVKYHKIDLTKPNYDIFIDDKAINNFKELDSYLKQF